MPPAKKFFLPRSFSGALALQKSAAILFFVFAAALISASAQTNVLAQYAGSASCRDCHKADFELWSQSHHGLAERVPQAGLDGPAFVPPRTFASNAQPAAVSTNGSTYTVTCIGLSRSNETHEVVRVIADEPLRQFLVAFPDGRLQALEAAWDPRSNEWFDVFGKENRQPGEWGHWTGRGMNWNSACAACHNTRLQKNYDAVSDTYHTTMAEKSVSCESCHGPLQTHVDWQKKYGASGKKDTSVPKFNREQVMDNCGFCHARRTDLTGDFYPGESFFDHQSLALVDQTDNFYADGQVRDEDYEFAAFSGSKMHARGVSCLDCHNPHSGKTLLPGNALCLRCHNGSFANAPIINPAEHTHHQVNDAKAAGGECVSCHMPQTVYMQRHWRHDHGFTTPDPLLTKEFAIPNACNRCHADKTADWALAACKNWYGKKMERPSRQRAEWIARARNGDHAAREPLIALLLNNPTASAATNQVENPYWEAVAAGLLGQWANETGVSNALVKSLGAAHPLVREAAVRSLEPLADAPAIAGAFRKLLDDPARSVRISAAWALRGNLPADSAATRDLETYLEINSDQPAGQLQEGAYAIAKNELPGALAHYQKAVTWDPNSAPMRHDLAIAFSLLGRTREAVAQLEAACRLDPKEAEYEFKLALAWNELGDTEKTARALEKAVQLNPAHGRAWLNLGLARNSLGQGEAALDALAHAETLIPADPEIPYARATILLRLHHVAEAKRAATHALELNSNYSEARSLLNSLERAPVKE